MIFNVIVTVCMQQVINDEKELGVSNCTGGLLELFKGLSTIF